jgi:hypothetical protein
MKLGTVLFLSLSLAVVSCTAKKTPAGSWDVDTGPMKESMMQTMGPMLAQMNAEQKQMLEKQLAGVKMSVDIQADGTWSAHLDGPQHEHIAGTWKLDGDKMTMTGKAEGEGEEEKVLTGTFKGDTMEMEGKEGVVSFKMPMKRK